MACGAGCGRERHTDDTGGLIAGANGIKTGCTKASGFHLVTSVERDGKQMIAVILGEDSARARDARIAALVMAYMGRMH
jgi:D-alanyl-D-alanine carboxypeptidase